MESWWNRDSPFFCADGLGIVMVESWWNRGGILVQMVLESWWNRGGISISGQAFPHWRVGKGSRKGFPERVPGKSSRKGLGT